MGISDTAAVAFGRMNPPTIAHELLVKTINKQSADPYVYLSHSSDPKKNPLSYDKKVDWCREAFENWVSIPRSDANNMHQVLTELYQQGYKNIIYLCGSDRAGEAEGLKRYNGKPDKQGNILYDFDSIKVVKVGEDRVNEDDVQLEMVSASRQRAYAADDDFESFEAGCPSKLDEDQRLQLFDDVREGMGLYDSLEELPEDIEINESNFTTVKITEDKYYERVINDFLSVGLKDHSGNIHKVDDSLNKDEVKAELMSLKDWLKSGNHEAKARFEEIIGMKISDIEKLNYSSASNGTYAFVSTEITAYQESIMGLILIDRVKLGNMSVSEFLLNSNPNDNSGIFKYIKCTSKDHFEDKWAKFVNDWGKVLDSVYENRSLFVTEANKHLSRDVRSCEVVHKLIKGSIDYSKSDVYDKADVYYCADLSVFDVMNSLKSDPAAYSSFVEENQDKVIGVSLKQIDIGKMKIAWDIPGVKPNGFADEFYIKAPSKEGGVTYGLQFKVNDSILELAVRSNQGPSGGGTLEWKTKNASAQMGKAVTAFKEYLRDDYPEYYDRLVSDISSRKRDFADAAKCIAELISDDAITEFNTTYQMSDFGKKFIATVLNLSCGFEARNTRGERISAPYIKLY